LGAISAVGLKLVMGQPQQGNTNLHIGPIGNPTRADTLQETQVEYAVSHRIIHEEILRPHVSIIGVFATTPDQA